MYFKVNVSGEVSIKNDFNIYIKLHLKNIYMPGIFSAYLHIYKFTFFFKFSLSYDKVNSTALEVCSKNMNTLSSKNRYNPMKNI